MSQLPKYPNPLSYKYKVRGTFDSIKTPTGYEVNTAPLKPLDPDDAHFTSLKRLLSNAHFEYIIYEDGSIWFKVPFSTRYGFILGAIARIYDALGCGEGS